MKYERSQEKKIELCPNEYSNVVDMRRKRQRLAAMMECRAVCVQFPLDIAHIPHHACMHANMLITNLVKLAAIVVNLEAVFNLLLFFVLSLRCLDVVQSTIARIIDFIDGSQFEWMASQMNPRHKIENPCFGLFTQSENCLQERVFRAKICIVSEEFSCG